MNGCFVIRNPYQCLWSIHIMICGSLIFSNQITSMILGENYEDGSPEMKGFTTVLGDESLPRLYEDSEISEEQLPRQHGN